MKRIYTFIVLLGLAMGMLLTGCKQEDSSSMPASTNAPVAPSTNK